jgi:hypothetical protein
MQMYAASFAPQRSGCTKKITMQYTIAGSYHVITVYCHKKIWSQVG